MFIDNLVVGRFHNEACGSPNRKLSSVVTILINSLTLDDCWESDQFEFITMLQQPRKVSWEIEIKIKTAPAVVPEEDHTA